MDKVVQPAAQRNPEAGGQQILGIYRWSGSTVTLAGAAASWEFVFLERGLAAFLHCEADTAGKKKGLRAKPVPCYIPYQDMRGFSFQATEPGNFLIETGKTTYRHIYPYLWYVPERMERLLTALRDVQRKR